MSTSTEPPAFTPTQDQQRALLRLGNFLDGDARQITLGGYAGTGKTTTIAKFIKDAREKFTPIVATPTGKAAHVLNKKGIPATTIHSLIYSFLGKWRNPDNEDIKLIFEAREENDTHSMEDAIVIVDEASMVNTSMYDDLCQHVKGRFVFVGDHGQLAPVGGDPGLMQNPDIKLETIMRQALESPIVRFAHKLRKGGTPEPTDDCSDDLTVVQRGGAKWTVRYCLHNGIDQLLVGFNALRHEVNYEWRAELGYTDKVVVGERMICLLNNYDLNIFNGTIVEVLKVHGSDSQNTYCDIREEGTTRVIKRVPMFTEVIGAEAEKAIDVPQDSCSFTYGYAITVHKAQGSEWHSVAVMDAYFDKWDMKRWRYTAATRAASRLHYLIK